MIDLHSHILAGIDDGAKTLSDTLAIAENSVANGVTHMMCTPHIQLGIYDNNTTTIKAAFQEACDAIHDANIPLKLAMGSEVRICAEVMVLSKQNQLPFIGTWNNRSALLLELPHSHIPPGVENLIHWLLKNGVQPIIPHPERNRDILANYSKAKWLKQLGCMFQVTAGAFVKRFSNDVFDTVWKMREDKLIAYVASDTHNVAKRPNDMQLAFDAVATSTNKKTAQALFLDIPKQLTSNVNWQ